MPKAIAWCMFALVFLAPPARAGDAGTALSTCLTGAVTQDDRRALVRWIFAALAEHPDVGGLVAIDASEREALEKEGAAVFERLVAQDCTAQSRKALVDEGTDGFGDAFKTVGEVAMSGVVEDPRVKAAIGRLGEHIDAERLLRALLSK